MRRSTGRRMTHRSTGGSAGRTFFQGARTMAAKKKTAKKATKKKAAKKK